MPRLFFGLEIPADIKDRLLKVQIPVAGAKWQDAGQLHLTLLFIGQLEQERLTALRETARDLPAESFYLQVTGLGCFGRPEQPRNLWAGTQPQAPLMQLQQTLKARVETLGLPEQKLRFRPHVTLARFKREAGSIEGLLTEQGERVFGEFTVTEFALFDSKPGPAGSVYTVIERFPLRACATGTSSH